MDMGISFEKLKHPSQSPLFLFYLAEEEPRKKPTRPEYTQKSGERAMRLLGLSEATTAPSPERTWFQRSLRLQHLTERAENCLTATWQRSCRNERYQTLAFTPRVVAKLQETDDARLRKTFKLHDVTRLLLPFSEDGMLQRSYVEPVVRAPRNEILVLRCSPKSFQVSFQEEAKTVRLAVHIKKLARRLCQAHAAFVSHDYGFAESEPVRYRIHMKDHIAPKYPVITGTKHITEITRSAGELLIVTKTVS
jgi:hypothetical protein